MTPLPPMTPREAAFSILIPYVRTDARDDFIRAFDAVTIMIGEEADRTDTAIGQLSDSLGEGLADLGEDLTALEAKVGSAPLLDVPLTAIEPLSVTAASESYTKAEIDELIGLVEALRAALISAGVVAEPAAAPED